MVEHLTSVDPVTFRFPPVMRQQLAKEVADPSTEIGASLFATIDAATANLVVKPQRATVTLTSVPRQLNNQRRYQQSAYSQDNVTTLPDGTQYVVLVGDDLHAWVCKRTVGSDDWDAFDLTTIPGNPFGTQVDDSHCTWALAVDTQGRVIVTGNAHTAPSVAAFTTTPGEISAWTMLTASANQQLTTYDQFAILDDGTVLRFWREGFATGGVEWVSRWNPATTAFENELAILDGLTDEGPYIWHVAVREQQVGLFFCWRGNGDASTNSDLGYMQSLDGGRTWQKITGAPYTLPVTHATADTIRAIPQGSGFVNQGAADIDPDRHPHGSYLMQDSVPYTQVWQTYWDGSAWVHDQLTNWSTLITTVGQTTLDLRIARPQLICTETGRTYVITRTWGEGLDGAPVMIDATPGANREPFKVAAMNLYGWEPAIDSRALRERDELTMLITPIDTNKDSKQGFVQQWGGIVTIQLRHIAELQGGMVAIPTIRVYSSHEWGPEFIAGTTTEANFIGKSVYVSSTSGGVSDLSIQIGPGVPQIPALAIGPGQRFFARQSVRITFQNGATSGDIELREVPSAGLLAQHNIAHIAIANSSYTGVQHVPFCPLISTPYVETDGTRRDTRLVPQLRSSVADGLKLGAWQIEIGILDWV